MVFDCLIPQCKHEWPRLRSFVSQYNTANGASYSLVKCLDIENRNVQEPEVLLVSEGLPPLVTERKSVVWPSDHGQRHSTYHYIFDCVGNSTGGLFADAPYELQIYETLEHKTKGDVKKIANNICDAILVNFEQAKSNAGISRSKPVSWSLRLLEPWEVDFDEPSTGLRIQVRSPAESRYTHAEARVGYEMEMWRALDSAANKFSKYDHCIRVLLMQFFGQFDLLQIDSELTQLVKSAIVPENIDEVWVADYDWVDLDEFEIIWNRIR